MKEKETDPSLAFQFRMPESLAREVEKIAAELTDKSRVEISRSASIRMLVELGVKAYRDGA
jgi:hypothetical protein